MCLIDSMRYLQLGPRCTVPKNDLLFIPSLAPTVLRFDSKPVCPCPAPNHTWTKSGSPTIISCSWFLLFLDLVLTFSACVTGR